MKSNIKKHTGSIVVSIILIIVAAAYDISPVDLVSDLIPVAGNIDDAGVTTVITIIVSVLTAIRAKKKAIESIS